MQSFDSADLAYKIIMSATNYVSALNRDEIIMEYFIRDKDVSTLLNQHLFSLRKELNNIIQREKFTSFTGQLCYKPPDQLADFAATNWAFNEIQEVDAKLLDKTSNWLAHYNNRVEIIQGTPKVEKEQLQVKMNALRVRLEAVFTQNDDEDIFGDAENYEVESLISKSSLISPVSNPELTFFLKR